MARFVWFPFCCFLIWVKSRWNITVGCERLPVSSLLLAFLWPVASIHVFLWYLASIYHFDCFLLVLFPLRVPGKETHDHDECSPFTPIILWRRKGRDCLEAEPCCYDRALCDILCSIPSSLAWQLQWSYFFPPFSSHFLPFFAFWGKRGQRRLATWLQDK